MPSAANQIGTLSQLPKLRCADTLIKSVLWLLFVSPREINKYEPFVDAVRPKINKTFLKKLNETSRESLEQTIELEKDLGKKLAGSLSTPLLAHAIEMFTLAGVPTYCFSGDDEGHDLGVSLSDKDTSFALRILRAPLAQLSFISAKIEAEVRRKQRQSSTHDLSLRTYTAKTREAEI